MTGWVETSLDHGVWLVLVIHGIDGVGYQPLPTERVRAFFDFVKAREDRLWVATFQDGTKYVRERMKSTIATTPAGHAIEVTVTHSLDPKLYDLPLTARTSVPANGHRCGSGRGRPRAPSRSSARVAVRTCSTQSRPTVAPRGWSARGSRRSGRPARYSKDAIALANDLVLVTQ
jgi:hypothetical protein